MSRRTGILLGGIAVILVAAIAVPLALSGGPGSTTAPSASGATVVVSSAPASALAPGGSIALESPAPGASGPVASGAGASPLSHPVVATRIVIARLGIDLPIVAGDGVDAPLYKVAHYPGSAWPGGGSNIYLYAHARTGMFLSLWNVKLGDHVVLDLANGSQRTYVVTEIMPKVAWDDMALLAPTPHEQLTLQTCTSYEETAPRFIVIAVPQT
jgi:LPXTG-site transpeptidase (sortase) family protein